MKITLNYNESLCWTCKKTTDKKCGFFATDGRVVPPYVTKTLTKDMGRHNRKDLNEHQQVVRACHNYEPCEEFVKVCKYCGEQYVIQSTHTVEIDGGYCYDCHVTRKETYKVPQPWSKPPAPPKQKKCLICGKTFAPRSTAQKYCSKHCAGLANSRNNRKRHKERSMAKKTKKSQMKWDFEHEKAALERKASNLHKETDKKYRDDVNEIKTIYRKKRDDFKIIIQEFNKRINSEQEKSLSAIESEYQKATADIDKQLAEAITEAKNRIYGGDKR